MSIPQILVFDFDSTIYPGESLDELIQFSLEGDSLLTQKSKQISEIGHQGMSGKISMTTSLEERLAIAAPNQKIIDNYINKNKKRIDKRWMNLLEDLQQFGHLTYVVSGGFEDWIRPMLEGIIPGKQIHANRIIDKSKPMTIDNVEIRAKEQIIKELKLVDIVHTIVGDGATDFSVYENLLAKKFIGAFFYTGIELRKNIAQKAQKNHQSIFSDFDLYFDYMRQEFLSK